MEAAAPVDYPPPSDFPQTLSVLDDQGHRIRYELDDEGNRIGQDADGRRLYESVQ
jgi:YD repeat-containing protein